MVLAALQHNGEEWPMRSPDWHWLAYQLALFSVGIASILLALG
jgi:hypothetical protein